eukprot:7269687-Prymnesium_polylepis.2
MEPPSPSVPKTDQGAARARTAIFKPKSTTVVPRHFRTPLCENLGCVTPCRGVSAGRERARACGVEASGRAFAPFLRLRHPCRSPP